MTQLATREEEKAVDVFDRFDRMFEEWAKLLPFRAAGRAAGELIRVDEFHEDGTLVVRAELPGLDPEKDVEVTVADRMLRISAERREEARKEETGYVRHELRYGSFTRVLALPAGATETDITASYKDGILEIRVPAPEPEPVAASTKVPIATA